MPNEIDGDAVEALLEEMALGQQKKVLACGRRIVPTLTTEDALQPNDYPELENHPHFRYEEGTLAGIQSVQMALRALTCGVRRAPGEEAKARSQEELR